MIIKITEFDFDEQNATGRIACVIRNIIFVYTYSNPAAVGVKSIYLRKGFHNHYS